MDRRIKKTKAAIQEAYVSLLMEKDTPKITITELTERADIDRKTFYLHYDSVDELVKESIENLLHQLLLILEEKNYFENPFEFNTVFQSINELLEQNLPFYRHIAGNSIFHGFWEQFQDILAQTTIEVYKDISAVPIEELEIYAKFYSAGITTIYADWLMNPRGMSIEHLGQVVSRVFGEGIPEFMK